MMRIDTKAYGSVDVDERQKIEFPYGILGFEKLKSYVLLDAPQQPFYWLQALLEEIGIDDLEKILNFAIVTIPQNPMEMTANLQGPIIINKETRVGRQSISTNPEWGVRHPILKELAAIRQQPC
jgi:flagellar assembly factor FliW